MNSGTGEAGGLIRCDVKSFSREIVTNRAGIGQWSTVEAQGLQSLSLWHVSVRVVCLHLYV